MSPPPPNRAQRANAPLLLAESAVQVRQPLELLRIPLSSVSPAHDTGPCHNAYIPAMIQYANKSVRKAYKVHCPFPVSAAFSRKNPAIGFLSTIPVPMQNSITGMLASNPTPRKRLKYSAYTFSTRSPRHYIGNAGTHPVSVPFLSIPHRAGRQGSLPQSPSKTLPAQNNTIGAISSTSYVFSFPCL